jgi:uncharacterized repeat protein (TIGR01451 family)
MKKMTLLSIAILLLTTFGNRSSAQTVIIPDPNFVTFLQNNFSSCMNGNQLNFTCPEVVNTTYLDCSIKGIHDLTGIEYFFNLDTLDCSYNNLTNLPVLPATVSYLFCQENDLVAIDSFPLEAKRVDCRNNQITSLGTFPSYLESFDASGNLITTLPALPASLQILRLTQNNISTLPALPSSLEELSVGYNQITALPALPAGLQSLSCPNNPGITTLSTLPASLKGLAAENTSLNSLPLLPGQMQTLSVYNTNLSQLPNPLPISLKNLSFGNPGFNVPPVFPSALLTLSIYSTDLITLPPIPSSVYILDIRYNNSLSTIPQLPQGLFNFYCLGNDSVYSLPPIPSTVKRLFLNDGAFTSIPELPDTLDFLYLQDNPLLTCLPQLKTIGTLNFQNTPINCIPDYGHVTTSTPLLSSLPLCDIFNSNGCSFYYNIAGEVFSDQNSNCINDPGEDLISSVKVNLYQSGNLIQQFITSNFGGYTFEAPNGIYTYSIDTMNMPFAVNCPPSGEHLSVLNAVDSVDLNMDFGIQCKLQDDLGIHTIVQDSGIFRPTQTTLINVIAGDLARVYNLNCAAGTSGTVTVFFAGPVQYAGNFPGSEVPVVTPNTLTYNIADFGTIDIYNAFKFYMTTDTNTLGIPNVCFTVNVTLLSGDLNPSNNTYTHCFAIWNSYDPNFKEANPANFIANTAEWLTYTIHFQNTGNAPALNIVISDTLDANLQESTFTYLQSSHEVFTQVTGNVIKFNFPNINLPDSTNDEPNSHGYVQYKVKIDQGLNVGQTIQNTAAIYFDFNTPVITNTTSTLIVAPTSVTSPIVSTWSVYPVPSSESFVITHPSLETIDLTITDIAGKEVSRLTNYKPGMPVNVVSWADGIYLIKITSGSTHETLKFIKAK